MNKRSASILFSFFLLASCNKDSGSKLATSGDTNDPMSLKGSIVSSIPKDSAAFFYFNDKTEAAKRLAGSQWAGDWSKYFDDIKSQGKLNELPLLKALDEAGLLSIKSGQIGVAQEASAFYVPSANPGVPDLGLVLVAKKDANVSEKLTAFQEKLKAVPMVVSPLNLPDGTGFTAVLPAQKDEPSSPELRSYVGWNGDFVVLTSTEARLNEILKNWKGNVKELPQVISSEDFRKASAGLGGSDVVSVGYADVARIIRDVPQKPEDKALFVEKFPVKAALMQVEMKEAPENKIRAVIEPKDEMQKQLLAAMPSITSEALLSMIPGQPMAYLSFNAELVAKSLSLSESSKDLLEKYPVINQIKRIGIAGKVAPLGQSLLPIPDLVVAVEANDGAAVATQVTQLASNSIQSSGLPAMPPTEKDLDGVKVTQIASPMGIGLTIASLGNVLIASNSESQVRSAISAAKGSNGAFASSLSKRGKEMFVGSKSVANVYVNFPEIAGFIENLGGVAQMFGGEEAAKNTSNKETIDYLKKQGTMLASVTVDGNLLSLESVYVK